MSEVIFSNKGSGLMPNLAKIDFNEGLGGYLYI